MRLNKKMRDYVNAECKKTWDSAFQNGRQAGQAEGQQIGMARVSNDDRQRRYNAVTKATETYARAIEVLSTAMATIAGELGGSR